MGGRTSEVLKAIAQLGLPGGPERGFGFEAVLDDQTWAEVVTASGEGKLLGLLVAAVAVGLFPVTARQRAGSRVLNQQMAFWSITLESTLLDLDRALTDADVDYRLLKGAAVAARYPEPNWRPFADIDLLVPGDQFVAAKEALARLGATREFPEVGPGFDERFAKGACLTLAPGIEVDLHRTFVWGPFGLTVDLPSLFAERHTVTVGGHEIPTLSGVHHAAHCVYGVALSPAPVKLRLLRDLAQLLAQPDVDPNELIEVARAWQALPLLAEAVRRLERGLGPSTPPELLALAESFAPDRRERRWLRSYGAVDRPGSWRQQALAGWEAVPTMAGKASYLYAILSSGLRRRSRARRHVAAAGRP